MPSSAGVGVPTLLDVVRELQKPGRDPRDELPPPLLRTDVMSIKDLKPGMVLTGTVRNVIDFGVFVDIGVHQDGLVHISQITDKFLKHPSQAVSVGDVVKVVVLEVDEKRKRISLSMKQSNRNFSYYAWIFGARPYGRALFCCLPPGPLCILCGVLCISRFPVIFTFSSGIPPIPPVLFAFLNSTLMAARRKPPKCYRRKPLCPRRFTLPVGGCCYQNRKKRYQTF